MIPGGQNLLDQQQYPFKACRTWLSLLMVVKVTGNHKIVGWRGKMVFDATKTMNKNEECKV